MMNQKRGSILNPGDMIGGCTIESRIASGGMGEVYLAQKKLLHKSVAIKVLFPQLLERQDNLARFLREAKVAANLDHPATVKVYDVGEDNGLYYMIMEHINGRDLKNWVMEFGPLSSRKVLQITIKLAGALSYAHNRGLIHRDIKPANILLSESGDPKLVDFGLARLTEEDQELTASGQILGTPIYMSPEQCRGDPLDGRSDLYSLGATLYFLLAGQVPFTGDSTPALIHKVINDMPTPLEHLVPDLPQNMAAIVKRLMTKHRSTRFQSAQELETAAKDALAERVVFASETTAMEKPAPKTKRLPWGRLVYLMLIGLIMGPFFYFIATHSHDVSAFFGATEKQDPVEPQAPPQKSNDDKPIAFKNDIPTPKKDAPQNTSQSPQKNTSLQKEFDVLKEVSNRCLNHFLKLDADQLIPCLDPDKADNIKLTMIFESILSTLATRQFTAASQQTSQVAGGKAQSAFSFNRPDSRETYVILIDWQLKDGQWYMHDISEVSQGL